MVSGSPKLASSALKPPTPEPFSWRFTGAAKSATHEEKPPRKLKRPSERPSLLTASSAAYVFEIYGARSTLSVSEFATGDCKHVPQGLKSPRENQDLRV